MELSALHARQGYFQGRPATAAEPGETSGGFRAGLLGATHSFAATLAEGEEIAAAAMTGRAEPQALVTALAQSQLAVETAVAVRNKVVEAYQELLRMPV